MSSENDNSESYGTQVVERHSANQITVTMYFGGFDGSLVPGSSLGSSPEGLVASGLESCVTRPVNDGLGFRTVSITPPKVILSTLVYRHPE